MQSRQLEASVCSSEVLSGSQCPHPRERKRTDLHSPWAGGTAPTGSPTYTWKGMPAGPAQLTPCCDLMLHPEILGPVRHCAKVWLQFLTIKILELQARPEVNTCASCCLNELRMLATWRTPNSGLPRAELDWGWIWRLKGDTQDPSLGQREPSPFGAPPKEAFGF